MNISLNNVFVVIPAYNEETIIVQTITKLIEKGYTIVVVDDGSTDNTQKILRELPIYYIRHCTNLGQGAALQTGMMFSISQGAEIIINFDADGQHNPEDIPQMLAPILEGKSEIVLGSRFLRSEDAQNVPLSRKILLKAAIVVNGLLTGLWLSDAHNGFRALSQSAAKNIRLKENGFSHATEILYQIHKKKIKVREIPVAIQYTKYSRSKGQSNWNAVNILLDLFDLLLNRMFK